MRSSSTWNCLLELLSTYSCIQQRDRLPTVHTESWPRSYQLTFQNECRIEWTLYNPPYYWGKGGSDDRGDWISLSELTRSAQTTNHLSHKLIFRDLLLVAMYICCFKTLEWVIRPFNIEATFLSWNELSRGPFRALWCQAPPVYITFTNRESFVSRCVKYFVYVYMLVCI